MDDTSLLIERAYGAVLSRDFVLAEKLYNKVLSGDSDNVSVLLSLGSMYVKWGKDEKACETYKRLLEIKADNTEAFIALGGIYRRLGKYDESITVLKQASSLSPSNLQITYYLGFTYKQMGMFEEAVKCFENVLENDPSDVLAYNHIGVIYAKRALHELAVEAYIKGLKIDPNHPVLHLNLAKSYVAMGEYEKAQLSYRACLKIKPGFTEAVDGFVSLLLRMGNSSDAHSIVNKALDINSKDSDLYVAKGNVSMYLEEFEEAEKAFLQALSFDAKSSRALKLFAQTEENLGKYDEAVDAVIKLEKSNPDDLSLLKFAVKVLLSADRLHMAHERLYRLWQDNSKDLDTLSLLGQYYMMDDKLDKSIECYRRINSINPSYTQGADEYIKRVISVKKTDAVKEYINSLLDSDSEKDTKLAHLLLSLFDTADAPLKSDTTARDDEGVSEFEKILSDDLSIDLSPVDISDRDDDFFNDNEEAEPLSDNGIEVVSADEAAADDQNSLNDDIEEMVDLSELKKDESQEDDVFFDCSSDLDELDFPKRDSIIEDEEISSPEDNTDKSSETEDDNPEQETDSFDIDAAVSAVTEKPPVFQIPDNVVVHYDNQDELDAQLEEALNAARLAHEAADSAWKAAAAAQDAALQAASGYTPEKEPLEVIRNLLEFLPVLVKIMYDRDILESMKVYIPLFIKLKDLLAYLPDGEREVFTGSKTKLLLDYILLRLSGTPGLLATADALKNAGFIYDMNSVDYEKAELAIILVKNSENTVYALPDDYLYNMTAQQLTEIMLSIK